MVSRAAKLPGYRFTQGSLANFLSPVRWVGLFSACVPSVPGVRSGSKEVCARREVGMPFVRADDGGGPTETEVRAHDEGVHRGRSPQGVGRRCRDRRTTHIVAHRWGAVGERMAPSVFCQDSLRVVRSGRDGSVPAGQLRGPFLPYCLECVGGRLAEKCPPFC